MYVVVADETDLIYDQIAIENLKKAYVNIIGSVLNKYNVNKFSFAYYERESELVKKYLRIKRKIIIWKIRGVK